MNVNTPRTHRNISRHRPNRRNRLAAFGIVPAVALLLAACGDPDAAGSDDTNPGTTPATGAPSTDAPTTTGSPTSDAPIPTDFMYSADPNDFVIRIAHEGGFVPVEVAFVNLPSLLVSGGGQVYTQAPMTMEYPGKLLAPLNVQSITPAGIQTLLRLAHDAGLLGEIPDYAADEVNSIADAPDTVVEIRANGTTYVHRAYALGIDPEGGDQESTPARQALLDFVQAAQSLEETAGDEVGEAEPFEASEYRLRALEYASDVAEVEAPMVEWPADAGVSLADATECAIVPADAIRELIEGATSDTLFSEGGKLYSLAITGTLPGDAGCDA